MSTGRFTAGSHGRDGAADTHDDLIVRLRHLPIGPVADNRFKSELRTQLVAITARVVSESAARPESETLRPRTRAVSTVGVGVLAAIRRPLLAFAAAAAALVLLLGVAVWISSGSLPGDSLYSVKRASENVQLSLASGDGDKGRAYLDLASKRAGEVIDLLGKSASASGPVSAHNTKLITDTLDRADSDSRSGMQLLGKATVAQLSADQLTKLDAWLPAQRSDLTKILGSIPAGTLHDRAQSSLTLLQRISSRAAALKANLGCPCLSSAVSDDLGPIPCSPCTSIGGAGTLPSTPSGGTGGSSQPGGPGTTSAPGSTSGSGGSTGAASGGLGGPLPSLSGGSASQAGAGGTAAGQAPGASLSTGSDGLGVGLPGVSVSVGPGGVSVSLPPLNFPGPVTVN